MAASMFTKSRLFCRSFIVNFRQFHSLKKTNIGLNTTILIGVPCACVTFYQGWKRLKQTGDFIPRVHAASDKSEKHGYPPQTYRELRFQSFASVEHDGVIYMTPQDFLESVTEDTPRPRIGRMKLTQAEVDSMLKTTIPRRKGSRNLFRSMHSKGIISYTEYLFLLCVLTKPQSGFRIAFNMFDTDGNQIVDKKEFLVLENFFILPPHEQKFVPRDRKHLQTLLDLEGVFSKKQPDGKSDNSPREREKSKSVDPVQDTTLLIHFFGQRGNDVLKYADFSRFMENLQSEIIELEFVEFSKGMQTISEEDFARILLRYTNLDKSEVAEMVGRTRSRMPEEKGITFQEFKQFCQFLNSLDDFAIAMKMYTFAQQPVSQEEFQRAVKICTGFTLGSHIVNTVFQIFDADGDGHLSYTEFINIMKDKMYRGSRSRTLITQGHWDGFKSCVKNEMKSY